MTLSDEPSMADLDKVCVQLNELMSKRPEFREKVKSLRNAIIEMKVASSELEELRQDYLRGNVTEENYRVRHKKLKTDYMLAHENLSDLQIDSLLGDVKDINEKSRLEKFRDSVISNKDKIYFLMEIGATLIKGAVGLK